MFIQRRAPHGTNYAHEGLEAALMSAAFEQDVALVFMDDGVFQLIAGQDTAALGVKNFTAAFGALGDYEVHKVLVEKESLLARGLTAGQLMTIADENNDGNKQSLIEIVDHNTLGALIANCDVLLNF